MINIFKVISPFATKVAKKDFLTITPTAMTRLQQIFSHRSNPNDIGVKVSLTKRGCNGLSYTMNYVQKPDKFDEVVDADGMKIIIDSKALMAIVGTQLDYVDTDISSQFVFNNPNEKGRCGCGESFHM